MEAFLTDNCIECGNLDDIKGATLETANPRRTNNDPENTTQKTKDRATQIH